MKSVLRCRFVQLGAGRVEDVVPIHIWTKYRLLLELLFQTQTVPLVNREQVAMMMRVEDISPRLPSNSLTVRDDRRTLQTHTRPDISSVVQVSQGAV